MEWNEKQSEISIEQHPFAEDEFPGSLFYSLHARVLNTQMTMWDDGERLNLEPALLLMQQNSTLWQGAESPAELPS